MSWKRWTKGIVRVGISAILLGPAAILQAASTPAKTENAVQAKTERVLRGIKVDAGRIQTAAKELDQLTKHSGSTWLDYDRQWNEIQPYVEDMQIKLWDLDSRKANMSAVEQKDVDAIQPIIQTIRDRAQALRMLLDKSGVSTSDARFEDYATSLDHLTVRLEKAIQSSDFSKPGDRNVIKG